MTARKSKHSSKRNSASAASARKAAPILVADLDNAELFHGTDGEAFMRIWRGDHFENLPVLSDAFKELYIHAFYKQNEIPPKPAARKLAISLYEARAKIDGPEWSVALRFARHGSNIYVDLADDKWRVVEISPTGWRVVADPPVRFRRSNAAAPLPEPVEGGNVKEILDFVNLPNRHDQVLYLSWIFCALQPQGRPFPVLYLYGVQGSGKSSAARIARKLVDPSKADLTTVPKYAAERNIQVAATYSHVLAYDNVSEIKSFLSDAFCRLSTGSASLDRKYYTNKELNMLPFMQRPVLLNGIGQMASRGDLLSRMITIPMQLFTKARIDEARLWASFHKAWPRILGALFTAISAALKNFSQVTVNDKDIRMVDFARWVIAGEKALGLKPGEFIEAYKENIAGAHSETIESSPIGPAILQLLNNGQVIKNGWSGTSSQLWGKLQLFSPEPRDPKFPRTAKECSVEVARIEPALLAAGIKVERWKDGKMRTRMMRFTWLTPPTASKGRNGCSLLSATAKASLASVGMVQ